MDFLTRKHLRETLLSLGIQPRRRLGQNFLVDRNARDKLISLAEITPGDIVVEIGPGLGALTESLVSRAACVHAFEVDSVLCAHLRQRFSGTDNFHLIEGDFLQTPERWWDALPVSATVVGNIPYGITSPILSYLIRVRGKICRALLTVQKEVGERFAAAPGSRHYGIPSVLLSLYTNTRICYALRKELFYPRPAVDSLVLKIIPRPATDVDPADEDAFHGFLPLFFHTRRKKLSNALGPACGLDKRRIEEFLETHGLPGDARAERVPPETILELFATIQTLKKGDGHGDVDRRESQGKSMLRI